MANVEALGRRYRESPSNLRGVPPRGAHVLGEARFSFSPDGRRILSGRYNGSFKLWNIQAAQVLSFVGHQGPVVSVAFSPDGRSVMSSGFDGMIKVWNAESGELVTTLIGDQKAWLALMPKGFFATSSPTDAKSLTIVRGLDVYDINQMYQALYEPDLVREKLAGDPDGEVREVAKVINLEKVLDSGPAPDVAITSHPQGRSAP